MELATVRSAYRESHSTEFALTKCMDGRVDVTLITGTPIGIITAFRSVGGIHNLEWKKFRRCLENWLNHAKAKKRSAVLIVTYHWSRGALQFGCKGFNYNLQAAVDGMSRFRRQVESHYRGEIWPVMVGLETDTNSLIVHSPKGEILDLGLVYPDTGKSFLEEKLHSMFVGFPESVLKDLASLFLGNVQYINNNKVKSSEPLDHQEQVLAIGDYVEWLPFGFALKLGLHDPVLKQSIVVAASIIHDNLLSGRIPNNGALFISVPYWQPNQRQAAITQSNSLFQIANKSIRENYPDMRNFFNPLVGVMDLSTNGFEKI